MPYFKVTITPVPVPSVYFLEAETKEEAEQKACDAFEYDASILQGWMEKVEAVECTKGDVEGESGDGIVCLHPRTSVDMDTVGAPIVCDVCGDEVTENV